MSESEQTNSNLNELIIHINSMDLEKKNHSNQ